MFENRRDKLEQRVKYESGDVLETFAQSRQDTLRGENAAFLTAVAGWL